VGSVTLSAGHSTLHSAALKLISDMNSVERELTDAIAAAAVAAAVVTACNNAYRVICVYRVQHAQHYTTYV
jgi:hypothetical protein